MFQFNRTSTILLFFILIALVVLIVMMGSGNQVLSFLNPEAKQVAIAKKAVSYINNNVIQPDQPRAILNSVSGESGVIKINISVGETKYDSYVSKDGKLLFPDAISLGSKKEAEGGKPKVDIKNINIQGSPFIGSDQAPVVIAYWFDYQCPFCKKAELESLSKVGVEYVDTGKVKIVYKDYQFLGDDSTTAGLAARAVWEVAPDKFRGWHTAMMEKQDEEHGGWGKKEDILALSKSLGIDSAKVDELMTSKKDQYQKAMDADKAEGSYFGVNGTPGFVIGNKLVSGFVSFERLQTEIEGVLNAKQ